MISIKSIKFLQPSKGQKKAREELQKQDFFQTLLTQMPQQFRPEEYQYLIDYVIPRRNDCNDRKRPSVCRLKNYYSTHSKEKFYSLTYSKGQIPKKIKPNKSFQLFNTFNDQERFSTSILNNETKIRQRKKFFMKEVYSHQQMKANTESQNKRKNNKVLKMREISFIDKCKERKILKTGDQQRLTKKSNKKLQNNLFTQQKIKRNYRESFIREIMRTQINNENEIRKKSIYFKQQLQEGKTHKPQTSFWEKEKELESKYRDFASIRFQTPINKSKTGLPIYNRKF